MAAKSPGRSTRSACPLSQALACPAELRRATKCASHARSYRRGCGWFLKTPGLTVRELPLDTLRRHARSEHRDPAPDPSTGVGKSCAFSRSSVSASHARSLYGVGERSRRVLSVVIGVEGPGEGTLLANANHSSANRDPPQIPPQRSGNLLHLTRHITHRTSEPGQKTPG